MSFDHLFKEYVQYKYKIEPNFFKAGFLHFFGIERNPFDKALQNIFEKSDKKALMEDWNAIGGDFKRVLRKHKPTGKAANVEI